MSQSNKELLNEEFRLWLKTEFTKSFWIGGHRFEKTAPDDVRVDKAPFSKEEAQQLFAMLTSRNPLARLNATLLIWERNGTLVRLLLIVSFLLLILVYINVRG